METHWLIATFIFGTIIGSFLNVVIYRLHTGKSLNGRSHCLSCGTHLMWYELFPIWSYIVLRARCRTCAAYIPSRYLIIELLTGILFVAVLKIFNADAILLILNFALVSVLVTILAYDVRHTIIPDELTLMAGIIAVLMLMHRISGSLAMSVATAAEGIIAGLCASGFFAFLWYVSEGKWVGFGDAKLAFPLGIIVGMGGIFSMIAFSFWIGAAIGILLLIVQRVLGRWKTRLPYFHRTLTMKSEVPFAPFLIAGFLLVQFLHIDVLLTIQNSLSYFTTF